MLKPVGVQQTGWCFPITLQSRARRRQHRHHKPLRPANIKAVSIPQPIFELLTACVKHNTRCLIAGFRDCFAHSIIHITGKTVCVTIPSFLHYLNIHDLYWFYFNFIVYVVDKNKLINPDTFTEQFLISLFVYYRKKCLISSWQTIYIF